MKKTLTTWLNYIETLHAAEIDLGLSRITTIAKQLQLTKFNCPVITIAGTNGKGSCVKYLEQIYLAQNYQVATYTSPHLLAFNERITINGQAIDDQSLVAAFEAVEEARGAMPLSFFEFTTAAALYFFQQIQPDIVILEVGLGGRLDAVNVVESDVAMITSIGIDHTEWLGHTREAIAFEKAGVFKQNSFAICGDKNPPATIAEVAENVGCDLYRLGDAFSYQVHQDHWQWQGVNDHYSALPLPHLKLQNAATALMGIELLQTVLPVSLNAIQQGLQQAKLPGRFECHTAPIHILFDVAHNQEAMAWLAKQLKATATKGRLLVVFSMLADKPIEACVQALLPLVDEWFIAELNGPRAAKLEDLAAALKSAGVKNFNTFETLEKALHATVEVYDKTLQDRVLVFGSFYTVSEAKQVFEQMIRKTDAIAN